VPEGFYELDWFNPQSNFFLSLHISYPNASDRILGSHQNPGGDIFLHGNCASSGAFRSQMMGLKRSTGLPFWCTAGVSSTCRSGFPSAAYGFRFENNNCNFNLESTSRLIAFWNNLKEGYDLFEKSHREPRIQNTRRWAYSFSGK